MRVARNAKRRTGAAVVAESALAAPSHARGIEISIGRNQYANASVCALYEPAVAFPPIAADFDERVRRDDQRETAAGRLRESRVRSATLGRTTSPPRTRSPALGRRRMRCRRFPDSPARSASRARSGCRPRTRARESPAPRNGCRAFDRAAGTRNRYRMRSGARSRARRPPCRYYRFGDTRGRRSNRRRSAARSRCRGPWRSFVRPRAA